MVRLKSNSPHRPKDTIRTIHLAGLLTQTPHNPGTPPQPPSDTATPHPPHTKTKKAMDL